MFPEGDIAHPQMSNEATDGLAPSVFAIFRAQLERILGDFSPTSEERPEPRYHGFGFASFSRGQVFPDGDIAGPNFNTAFDPSLEYSTDKVVLFWQPPFYFAHCGPLRRLP